MTRLPKLQKNPRDAGWVKKARALHDDADFRSGADANMLLRKNYEAHGSFRREDRPRTLDNLGFASQLIFTTWCLGNFGLDESGPIELAYAAAQAHNRMMVDFCSVDRRFLGTGYVPLVDFERAKKAAREAIDLGCKALLIASQAAQGTFAEPHRARSDLGDGAGSGLPDRVPCRRRGKTRSPTISRTACRG